ncbi:uncharacterized protein LOC121054665 [Oryza brachyantha]|uniref:Late embryogenesis abundant protein LEA-2 subgroup domain-containing protein n=1 Tax=Oryza brachyantha TaxID=4533 RepID=J3MAU2_ORYBR|nr:uncharacterized protein LOC121054665 [Oryza brachyantha]
MKGVEDDGRGRSVPCLVAVRCVVATAVSVVAFVMVVMVIITVRRPEEIQVVVDRGYVAVHGMETAVVGNMTASVAMAPAPAGGHRRLLSTAAARKLSEVHGSDTQTVGGGEDEDTEEYYPTFRIVLKVSSPTGRGDDVIDCNTTIGLVDVLAPPSAPAGSTDAAIVLFGAVRFSLDKESSHTLLATATIGHDEAQRRYVTERYRNSFVFQVAVKVQMIATRHSSSTTYTFNCWPVTVGDGYAAELVDDDDVLCTKTTSHDKWIPKLLHFPAPPPTS